MKKTLVHDMKAEIRKQSTSFLYLCWACGMTKILSTLNTYTFVNDGKYIASIDFGVGGKF